MSMRFAPPTPSTVSLCGPVLHSYSCSFSWAVRSRLWTRPGRVSHSCSKADIGGWCVFVGECTCVGEHGCAQVCVRQTRVYRRRRGFVCLGRMVLVRVFCRNIPVKHQACYQSETLLFCPSSPHLPRHISGPRKLLFIPQGHRH